MKLKKWSKEHSIIMSIVISILFMIAFKSISYVAVHNVPNYGYLKHMITDGIGVCLAISILLLIGDKTIITRRKKGFFKGLFIGGPIVVIACFAMVSNIMQANSDGYTVVNLTKILLYLATMIGIGITEEFVFRGVIVNLLLNQYGSNKKGVWFSILVSSILFGSMHFFNILAGVSFTSAFIQVVLASAMGAVFGAIYYRTDNIWVVVFLHGLMDFSSLLLTGIYSKGNLVSAIDDYTFLNLLGAIPYIIIVVFLLRDCKMDESLGRL